ncbi:MAG: tRNA epoxyqueuosine(34) reductase QueG [Phycisphaerae bacterium]|nr:tRNA epoxyqueuosine(34) reductase QueG [Phycisphaerae bacterium]NUQ46910.1 tRNA epoxyqueuosine(34) reductase QueG [Phycisphaerae bacterium]
MTPVERSDRIKSLAAAAGFERCGIARLGPLARGDYFLDWLRDGMAGTMGYLHRRRESRLDPSKLLPGARSAVVVALNYFQRVADTLDPTDHDDQPHGRVAMYAWGDDYHAVLHERLENFVRRIRAVLPDAFEAKVCVDTSAIVERELAAAAGIGWIGKNTLVLHQDLGSYFFLGEILTTLDLAPDATPADRCGTCTRCLDACPTQAFPGPYRMDARRCISYLTIEHRGEIPAELHAAIGDWVFGCDVCQQVCPYNRDAPTTREPRFAPRPPGPRPRLGDILAWDEATYARNVNDSATDRATLNMWRRNAAIAAKNV